ncbi:hypothetical protein TIFTF001_010269 [Ficus carica]|uniref:F-box domain-containing protein n=1 Tax=Ficus carica TaxID=3494 RepID=A0AA88ABY5_FICCA|nr:hypothetical protein TIFTF001_010269 [Ficus carica]
MFFNKRTKTLPNAAAIAAISNSTPPSRSAETIAHNDDLLIEILLRLPIKSLLKFKSVCKHWLSLISDPNFSLRRNSIPVPVSGIFFSRSSRNVARISEFDFVNLNLTDSSKSPFRSLPFADDSHSGAGIGQSCNGLLLCYSIRVLKQRDIFVFNPTTKQCTKLPSISQFRDGALQQVSGLSLAFDPSNSPHYKVVCVWNSYSESNQHRIEIYSSETRQWKLCGSSFSVDNPDLQFDGGVYWNGSVHWISNSSNSLYLKVEEERISPMPMPPIPEGNDWDHVRMFRYFGESRGHLHLIDHLFDLHTPRFDVLEMEMDYSGWFVKFRVDLSEIPSSFPQIVRRKLFHQMREHDYVFSVLCVVRGEVDEESYLVIQIPGKFIRSFYGCKSSHSSVSNPYPNTGSVSSPIPTSLVTAVVYLIRSLASSWNTLLRAFMAPLNSISSTTTKSSNSGNKVILCLTSAGQWSNIEVIESYNGVEIYLPTTCHWRLTGGPFAIDITQILGTAHSFMAWCSGTAAYTGLVHGGHQTTLVSLKSAQGECQCLAF